MVIPAAVPQPTEGPNPPTPSAEEIQNEEILNKEQIVFETLSEIFTNKMVAGINSFIIEKDIPQAKPGQGIDEKEIADAQVLPKYRDRINKVLDDLKRIHNGEDLQFKDSFLGIMSTRANNNQRIADLHRAQFDTLAEHLPRPTETTPGMDTLEFVSELEEISKNAFSQRGTAVNVRPVIKAAGEEFEEIYETWSDEMLSDIE